MDKTPKQATGSHQSDGTAIIAHNAQVTPRDAAGEPLGFDVATTVWLTSMAGLSPRTLALGRESVAYFAEWCTERGIAGVNFLTPGDLVAYRGEWQTALDAGEYEPKDVLSFVKSQN